MPPMPTAPQIMDALGHRILGPEDTQSYALCIIEDPQEKNLLFLGTDDGLYYSTDAAKNLDQMDTWIPNGACKRFGDSGKRKRLGDRHLWSCCLGVGRH